MNITKYGAMTFITGYYLFVTFLVNATGGQSPGMPDIEPGEVPTNVLTGWGAIRGFINTFWEIMTFQITDLPYWISITFLIGGFIMFLLAISLIRGTD
jgi:hypothetical protein